jgi:diacylglycerol kinase (ATP)
MGKMSLQARWKSFTHAWSGLCELVVTEANARIHLAASLAVLALGLLLGLAPWEWVAIILATALVWTAEALNSALERLADAVTRDVHPSIRAAKDIAAGAVLAAAIAAAAIGALVLGPRLLSLFAG